MDGVEDEFGKRCAEGCDCQRAEPCDVKPRGVVDVRVVAEGTVDCVRGDDGALPDEGVVGEPVDEEGAEEDRGRDEDDLVQVPLHRRHLLRVQEGTRSNESDR